MFNEVSEESLEEGTRDYWTIKAMEKFGGSFVKGLAIAASSADRTNLNKIKTAWPEYWNQYEAMGRDLEKNYGS